MKSIRNLVALVFLALIAAGCGRPVSGPVPSSPRADSGYRLYEATSTRSSQQLSVIDLQSRSVLRSLPLGTLSGPSHLYTIESTKLLDIDPQTGATQAELELPGRYQLPRMTISGIPGGVSQDGRWLVAESFDGATNALPTATHMLLIDASRLKVVHRLDLKGDFQFDAVSNDGERIYLIEYLNRLEYNVRLFNVIAGVLDSNIVVDKADGNQSMAGQRLSGVASPDGHWLYSMYVREHDSPFIHALSMDGPYAFCIDLPGNGYASANGSAEFHWSLAMSRDGSRLYAANGLLGLAAQIETATNYSPAVKRLVHYDSGPTASSLVPSAQAKEIGGSGAAVSPDGRTLVVAGEKGITWIDGATLRASDHSLTDWRIWSVAMSDGGALYAVNDAGMLAELAVGRDHPMSTFNGAPGQPIGLLRVDGGAS